MALMPQLELAVTEQSQVSEARRRAVAMASALGFSDERSGTVALVVTEAATNLIKHAQGGTVILGATTLGGVHGITMLALDRGPGISNFAASLRDGHSTAGSPGFGLGTLSRLSANFDVYSKAEGGTVLRCVVWAGAAPQPDRELEYGTVCLPMKGETVSGDDWALHSAKGRHILLLVDGLGHGPDAAKAAAAARKAVEQNVERKPAEQMHAIHGALRSTRGAAAAVIEMKPSSESGTFCGIGNIAAFVRANGAHRNLASHNGILGHNIRHVQEFGFSFPRRSLLFAYSDGMTSRWDPGAYPGLESKHPGLIAGVLYRDHSRARDDTTIVVVRNTCSV